LGAGTGDRTLGLAPHVAHIEAVEPAQSMLAIGRARCAALGNVEWVHARAEDHAYRGKYALGVATESILWGEPLAWLVQPERA
ncbi:MAG TPA: methyltransferase domain-containing protein, partial [Polyangiales bacterium]|nr:methyltransferase domain-containing protein [Polyangiales bacterium]